MWYYLEEKLWPRKEVLFEESEEKQHVDCNKTLFQGPMKQVKLNSKLLRMRCDVTLPPGVIELEKHEELAHFVASIDWICVKHIVFASQIYT